MKNLAERSAGSLYWWLLATLFLPIAIPGLVLKLLTMMKEQRNARHLNGKVSEIRFIKLLGRRKPYSV